MQSHFHTDISSNTQLKLIPPPPAAMPAISGHLFINLLTLLSLLPLSHSSQLHSLLNLKSFLNYSNPQIFNSWTPQNSICNFTGILCNENQLVKEINLPQSNLTGTLPLDSICSIESLDKISLEQNSLSGSISHHLSNCTGLHYLDLAGNSFAGEFPDLSSLTQLRFLNLNSSGFSGPFPWRSLENLKNLSFLSLGDNHFNKTSSFPLQVTKLDKLYWLYLTNCSIQGKIPQGIGNLTFLENLELSDNYLFGEIPQGISKLVNLRQLELYNNRLTGEFPIGFRNLTSLVNLDVSNNSLNGEIFELKFLAHLESLQLFENEFSGEIPIEFGEFKFLEELSLYTNKFSGSLPEKIGSWADFVFIDVSENFLTGPIPPDICKNGKLSDLLLLQNNFSGGLPENYANCSSLIRVRVNNNSLSGTIPTGIWSLPKLSIIDLTFNQFEGSLSSNINKAESLAQLFLSHNRFSGELPAEISDVMSLVAIDLSWNQLLGEIPVNIGHLQRLSSIHLEHNLFSGSIPDSLGSCVSVSQVNLAGNSLSGQIPETIGSLRSLNSLNLSNNKLSGEIPVSLSSLRLSLFDLSNNMLAGRIPESLSIGAFKSSFSGNPGLCSEGIENFRPCSSNPSSSGHLKTFLSCFIAGATALFLSLTCFIIVKMKQKDHDRLIKQHKSWNMQQFHVLTFREDEILKEIKQENLIGRGGSGNVYKITLRNGKKLAAKHIWKSSCNNQRGCQSSMAILGKMGSQEYDAEVATLSSVRHMNVVKLYCSITSEDSYVLVYEYMVNGSLWDQMHTGRMMEMDWDVRYEVAIGSARGLEYLHHGCDRQVIHRDVKSSNILLDENLKPKIADFGLAKVLDQSNGVLDSTRFIAGTHGYIAPEYAYTYKVNEKSDVYSFGVVLMELVTGKRAVEPEFGENNDIVQWVCNAVRNGKINGSDLVDSSISKVFIEDAIKVLRIAVHCTMKIPAVRPSMRMVVQMLEEARP